jgi:crossover junction endodeoxyribonuclease RuvC
MYYAYLGIDIGKGGAVTALIEGDDQEGLDIQSHVTPTLPDGDIDSSALYKLIAEYEDAYVVRMITVEKVHAIFGCGAGATFEFGRSAGIVEGIVCSIGLPYTMVQPKIWQKEMWAGVDKVIKAGKKSTDTKATSLIATKRLFPSAILTDKQKPKSSKVHDGIVDAILLAEYGRRLWKGTKQ